MMCEDCKECMNSNIRMICSVILETTLLAVSVVNHNVVFDVSFSHSQDQQQTL